MKKDNGLAELQTELSMDVNAQYKSAMLEFDMTQSLVGRYVGLEPSRVSRALTEEIPFDHSESKSIEETITAIRLVQSQMPLPINWAMIGKVKPLVDARRKELQEQADPILKKCLLIRVTYTGFFLRVHNGEVVTTPSEMTAAAFETPDMADQVVRELKRIGAEARIESFGAFRRRSTMAHSLIELGIETKAAVGGTDEQTNVEA